jgi:TPR repeat protein
MRKATLIAVVVGGAAGAAAALARMPSPPAAPEIPAPELRPAAALPTPTPARPAAEPAPTAAAAALAVTAPSASAAPDKAEAPPPATPPVSTRYELTGYEIACYEKKDPGACRAAASAYEEGKVVEADLARARQFRKIELTFLVKHCESQLPAACVDLAYRYQRGDGVVRSERNAQALLQRARELCAGRRAEICRTLARP